MTGSAARSIRSTPSTRPARRLGLAGRRDEARRFVARLRERLPGYDVEALLRAFCFDAETERLFRRTAKSIGFGS